MITALSTWEKMMKLKEEEGESERENGEKMADVGFIQLPY